jgi:hypothetical protein
MKTAEVVAVKRIRCMCEQDVTCACGARVSVRQCAGLEQLLRCPSCGRMRAIARWLDRKIPA